MKTWSSLPIEVCEQVFEQIASCGKRDLQQCCLTSRGWNNTAQKYMYKHINYGGMSKDKRLKLLRTLSTHFELGKYTKSIDLGMPWEESFDALPALFPNVELLAGNIMTTEFWSFMGNEYLNGKWTSIKQLPNFKPEHIQEYLEVAFLHTNTLESIQAQFYPNGDALSAHGDVLRRSLPQFVHLKTLNIEYHHVEPNDVINESSYSLTDPIQFDQIVEGCGNTLTKISCQIYVKSLNQHRVSPNILFSGSDLTNVIQRPLIKHFYGQHFLYTKNCTAYFMHKFPKLDHFEATQILTELHLSDNDFAQFFEFTGKIRKFCIGGEFATNANLQRVLRLFLASSNFPEIAVHLQYNSERSSNSTTDDALTISAPSKLLTTEAWAGGGSSLFILIKFKNTIDSEIRHNNILDLYGTKIKQLRFDSRHNFGPFFPGDYLDDSELDTCKESDDVTLLSLNKILQSCVHLETLSLYGISIPAFDNDTETNISIKKLELIMAVIQYDTVLPQIATKLPNLVSLSIEDSLFCNELERTGTNVIRINMSNTCLDDILWGTYSPEVLVIGLRLCIDGVSYSGYFDVKGEPVHQDTFFETYETNSVFLDISCKYLRRLSLRLFYRPLIVFDIPTLMSEFF
ncbi:uncharacterized protein EV154DRAFT_526153 [Mucor mucedo]|uniref:uncharacterized protein n=1 Tax=Mucor mucedo TaxID=29922 RepID=UPI00221E4C6D|nr:uncharacterized protein EV154DRAFT_526153 [Mucor mucedo]KAI7876129.1 hypothetical protein EV154DRAFT_526153 [Mucor mucedo]